jgi:hypothetical protein
MKYRTPVYVFMLSLALACNCPVLAQDLTTKSYHSLVDGNDLYSACRSAQENIKFEGEKMRLKTSEGSTVFSAGICWGYVEGRGGFYFGIQVNDFHFFGWHFLKSTSDQFSSRPSILESVTLTSSASTSSRHQFVNPLDRGMNLISFPAHLSPDFLNSPLMKAPVPRNSAGRLVQRT